MEKAIPLFENSFIRKRFETPAPNMVADFLAKPAGLPKADQISCSITPLLLMPAAAELRKPNQLCPLDERHNNVRMSSKIFFRILNI
ncbi:MAG: hypothetical protein GYA43_02305 [Bacteroidales bacterium]|nr:hypothetical protein [Bacteroidales bacterium]